MRRRSFISTALAMAAIAAGSATASATLFVSISNTAAGDAISATSTSLTFVPSSDIGPFICTGGTLAGVVPDKPSFQAPLGTPVLPIGTITSGTVTGCSGSNIVIVNSAGTAPWRMALNAVLLTSGLATGALVTVLGFEVQIIGAGKRCLYRGALNALYDDTTGQLALLGGMLPYWFGSCAAGSYLQVIGTYTVPIPRPSIT